MLKIKNRKFKRSNYTTNENSEEKSNKKDK